MFHTSFIEINKNSIENNISFLKNTLGENVKISSVVKGNAYGHGEDVFVPLVENCGINHFSVFSAAEALNVKKVVKKKTDVMIMGMIDNEELEWAIENDIEFYIFDLDRFHSALNISKKLKKPANIHIEIETGMNRTGFNAKSLREVIKLIKQEHKNIKFKGLCTHYAGAESIANFVRIKKQIKHFNKIKKWLNNENMNPQIYHTACSAAAISYPQTRMDMVRIGILQYGFWPSKETLIDYLSHKEDKRDPLRRVISWKSKIMNTKDVSTGEFIGYGTTYLALDKMRIGMVPIGYAHGFSRSLSNQGRVLVKGQRVPVVGMVNMNIMTIDITKVPDVNKGDEVVIIGEQGDLSISVASFSEMSNQLNYELLTRLPNSIPRKIIG